MKSLTLEALIKISFIILLNKVNQNLLSTSCGIADINDTKIPSTTLAHCNDNQQVYIKAEYWIKTLYRFLLLESAS